VNFLDDHSRLCVASVALTVTRATDIAEIFITAAQRFGTPASMLTDNGCIYTAKYRGGKVITETLLETLGVTYKHARPYHPQTCGKVERFHQTLKQWLTKHPATDLTELQAHLDRFVTHYNDARPHRALGRRTPREIYDTKLKARAATTMPEVHFRIRHDRVDTTGCVSLRYQSRLHHIGVGRGHAGTRVVLLIADRDIRIVTQDGELLRHLELDPTRDYQPNTKTRCLR
jgi:hypothetical protein